eukprot:CAMPEP_0194281750 /NCGR_PEP_ID=MMETSP0169-20130528/21473_1 /TAXON_ID=218684 /ORGANISM="Corethron pennatum, Strain L29A3" /LENGTH=467 /DNA_ID=CAMNT_0039026889 /DNA_START=179 /DNA_END=1582 /DNA_ORIENTATION=+
MDGMVPSQATGSVGVQQQNSEGMSAALSPTLGPIEPASGWFDILDAEVMAEQQQQQQAIINSLVQPSVPSSMASNMASNMMIAQAQQQAHAHGQQRPQYVQYTIQPILQQQHMQQQHIQQQHMQQQPVYHAMQALQPMQMPVQMPVIASAQQAGGAPGTQSATRQDTSGTSQPQGAATATATATAAATAAASTEKRPADPPEEQPPSKKSASEERAAARVERKRDREKRRREDVNKQFDELSTLLQRIAPLPGDRLPGTTEGVTATPQSQSLPSSSALAGPSNRADLLSRTCSVMQEIHDARSALADQVMDLRRKLIESKTNAGCHCGGVSSLQHHVMMMVPMMVPIESVPTNGVPVARVPMANVRNGLLVQAVENYPSLNGAVPPQIGAPGSVLNRVTIQEAASEQSEDTTEAGTEDTRPAQPVYQPGETSRGRSESLAFLSELPEFEKQQEPSAEKESGSYAHCA